MKNTLNLTLKVIGSLLKTKNQQQTVEENTEELLEEISTNNSLIGFRPVLCIPEMISHSREMGLDKIKYIVSATSCDDRAEWWLYTERLVDRHMLISGGEKVHDEAKRLMMWLWDNGKILQPKLHHKHVKVLQYYGIAVETTRIVEKGKIHHSICIPGDDSQYWYSIRLRRFCIGIEDFQ